MVNAGATKTWGKKYEKRPGTNFNKETDPTEGNRDRRSDPENGPGKSTGRPRNPKSGQSSRNKVGETRVVKEGRNSCSAKKINGMASDKTGFPAYIDENKKKGSISVGTKWPTSGLTRSCTPGVPFEKAKRGPRER